MIEDLAAFQQGEQECLKVNGNTATGVNPYQIDTVQWRNWNKGWNNQIGKFIIT